MVPKKFCFEVFFFFKAPVLWIRHWLTHLTLTNVIIIIYIQVPVNAQVVEYTYVV